MFSSTRVAIRLIITIPKSITIILAPRLLLLRLLKLLLIARKLVKMLVLANFNWREN
jgi:hypothetical protein